MMSSDCFSASPKEGPSAVGSDGGTPQSHMRKGAASSAKNLPKRRRLVSQSQSRDVGGVKL